MKKIDEKIFRTVSEAEHMVAVSGALGFVIRHLKETYRLYHDILDEEARWIAFRRYYGCGMMPAEALCKVLLIRFREQHKGLRGFLW